MNYLFPGTRFRWTVVDNNKMIDGLAQQVKSKF